MPQSATNETDEEKIGKTFKKRSVSAPPEELKNAGFYLKTQMLAFSTWLS
jgi:hypothetical protein